jgi:hypothetical protein
MNDRELAAKVRTKALNDIYYVLEGKNTDNWSDYRKTILANLSKSILPRLNEHAGPDGKELPVPILNINGIQSDNGNKKNRRI